MYRTITDGGVARSIFYFAYGSNMNPAQMHERLPHARRVGTGYVDGWEVRERKYANIERCRGGRVYGVIYLLTESEVNLLDRYEGYPRVYTCTDVRVNANLGPGVRTSLPCMTYVLTPSALSWRMNEPYPAEYRRTCSIGARMNRIPNEFCLEDDESLITLYKGFSARG